MTSKPHPKDVPAWIWAVFFILLTVLFTTAVWRMLPTKEEMFMAKCMFIDDRSHTQCVIKWETKL